MSNPVKLISLKDASIADLMKELESRSGVKKVAVGPYQNYRLEPKYDTVGKREDISGIALIVDPLTP